MQIYPDDLNLFKLKALQWAASFETACYFDSNGYIDPYSAFDVLIAAGARKDVTTNTGGAFPELAKFIENSDEWAIGFLGYDLKNETEVLQSSNPDYLGFPDLYFFNPVHLIRIKGSNVDVLFSDSANLINEIDSIAVEERSFNFEADIKSRFPAQEYKEEVLRIKQHIQRGDIYEATFCQEFYSENCRLNPIDAFKELNKVSPCPFATFFKFRHNYIIGATPERFLGRRGDKLISQPIKGTIRRSHDPKEDQGLIDALKKNPKEQSENVMIVDLVRNDLTRCAVPGTVHVEELFGIYSFEQVHQMISTVVCQADPQLDNLSIIRAVFPMGSMTGAPKISAMEIIEKHERTKRGAFSGAIGYFEPGGDFDFNVVIRTLLYNAENNYLSFHVGSAITFESDPDQEYEECLLKAKAIKQILSKKHSKNKKLR